MAPKVTIWSVLLIVSCGSICCPTCATCDAIWTMGICRDCESKKTPDRYSLELWQIHLRAMASHIKKWSRFDTMMFTYIYFGHYLALIHFSTNVPKPMLLRNEPQIVKLGSIPNFCADCFCCLGNAFFNCGN